MNKRNTLIIVIIIIIAFYFLIRQNNTETDMTKATIKTNKGDIELELYPDKVPNTVENFVR